MDPPHPAGRTAPAGLAGGRADRSAGLTERPPAGPGLVAPAPHPDRIALGVRQPWCELILRGTKTLEIRTRPTEVRGPIYLYSAKKFSELPELDEVLTRDDLDLNVLPRGAIVGSVEIVGCRPATPADAPAARVPVRELADRFAWELANPVRYADPLRPRFLPYGVWFYPFKRRHS